jgi:hypothetical protein
VFGTSGRGSVPEPSSPKTWCRFLNPPPDLHDRIKSVTNPKNAERITSFEVATDADEIGSFEYCRMDERPPTMDEIKGWITTCHHDKDVVGYCFDPDAMRTAPAANPYSKFRWNITLYRRKEHVVHNWDTVSPEC